MTNTLRLLAFLDLFAPRTEKLHSTITPTEYADALKLRFDLYDEVALDEQLADFLPQIAEGWSTMILQLLIFLLILVFANHLVLFANC